MSGWGNTPVLGCLWARGTVPSEPFGWLFLEPQVVSSCWTLDVDPLQIPGVCCISLCLGIPAFLVSLTLSCVSSTQGICRVLPGFPLPEPWPVSWDNGRAHLTCFLSLEDHYPLLPDVQCLELPFHVFCSFLVSGRRVISVSYSILVGSGSPVFPF